VYLNSAGNMGEEVITTSTNAMLIRSTKQTEYPPVTDELLETIVQRITEAGSPLRIILFGSRARGNTRPDSDLDILMIEEPEADLKQLRQTYSGAIYGLYPELDIRVDTVHNVAAWRNVLNHYLTEAMRNGRVLFSDNERLAKYCQAGSSNEGN